MFKKKIKNYIDYNKKHIIDKINKNTNDKYDILLNELRELNSKANKINNTLEYLKQSEQFPKYDSLMYKKKEGKKKILVCGFYGAFNLGDELMAHALLSKIDMNKYDVTVMISNNEHFDPTKYKKVNFIYFPRYFYEFSLISSFFDAIIWGGGALIDDDGYDNREYISIGMILNKLTASFINQGKPVYLYGLSSTGKFTKKEFLKDFNYLAKKATYFSLRDTNSKEVLEENGIDVKKVKIVHDLVFTYDELRYEKKKQSDENYIKVGVDLILNEQSMKNNKIIISKLINYLDNLNKNYVINLIPYYTYQDNDFRYLQSLKDELDNKNIKIYPYSYNIEEITNIIDENDYFVCSRYHMSLLTNALNKQVLFINYDIHRHYNVKNKYLYNKYGFNKNYINFSELKNIDTALEKLFNTEPVKFNLEIVEEANKELNEMLKLVDCSLNKK